MLSVFRFWFRLLYLFFGICMGVEELVHCFNRGCVCSVF